MSISKAERSCGAMEISDISAECLSVCNSPGKQSSSSSASEHACTYSTAIVLLGVKHIVKYFHVCTTVVYKHLCCKVFVKEKKLKTKPPNSANM